jgi:hypothetical protein
VDWKVLILRAVRAVTLIHQAPKYAVTAQIKWLPELYTKNRLQGDWFWVSIGARS